MPPAALAQGDGEHEQTARLFELSVQWVLANPQPIALAASSYQR
ncbi:hypothetical protein [Phytopseudomonas dryadis]|nr:MULTISPECIES: hypothetical protein [Pseudomonas]